MVDEISPRSGVLDCEQGGATFYEENYKFRIMNNVPFKATSSRTEDYSKLAQSNKYFHGTTHDGSDIAVYCGSRTMPPLGVWVKCRYDQNLHCFSPAAMDKNASAQGFQL